MKLRLNPVEISLKDLPLEGRDYEYTRQSGELNESLKDLLHNNDYKILMNLKPMGNTFELKASIETSMDMQCSLCASDFKQLVKTQFHEFLVIEKPLEKGDLHVRVNHAHEWESNGPEATILQSGMFHVGEYFHEQIALNEPIRPLCKPENEHAGLEDLVKRDWLTVGPEASSKDTKANPFKILEKIKLRS
jgi:uncharacterized metal-binding protein YceD (DUF177 family)